MTRVALSRCALQQRNSLLRAIREETAGRAELHFWDAAFLDSGGALVEERPFPVDLIPKLVLVLVLKTGKVKSSNRLF